MKRMNYALSLLVIPFLLLAGCAGGAAETAVTAEPTQKPTITNTAAPEITATPLPSPTPTEIPLPTAGSVTFEYLGNSCILIKASDGTVIVSDPYYKNSHPAGLKVLPSDIRADAVTISHIHPDHNYSQIISGDPQILNEPGAYQVGSIQVTGYAGFEGSPHGPSTLKETIFVYEVDGVKIVQLGDSGIVTDPEVLAAIDSADLVVVNIDGYVIPQEEILPFLQQIHARSMLFAHYSMEGKVNWNGAPTLNEFLATLPEDLLITRGIGEISVTPGMPVQALALTPLMISQ